MESTQTQQLVLELKQINHWAITEKCQLYSKLKRGNEADSSYPVLSRGWLNVALFKSTPPVFGPSEYLTYHALCVSEIWTLSLKSVITVQKMNVANVRDKVVCMYKQAVCVIISSVHISLNRQGIYVISRPPVFVFCSVFFCFSSSTQHLISTDWWWTECSILWINRFALKLYACNRFFLLYLSNRPGYWASTKRARLQQAASQPCIWPEVKN